MWLFTKYGFYSVVCARQGEGQPGKPIDPNRVMVRARLKTHLEALRKRFPAQLGDVSIVEMLQTDYRYRILLKKSTWTEILAALSDELDYGNFKAAADQHLGRPGREYVDSLHDVWEIMYRLQK